MFVKPALASANPTFKPFDFVLSKQEDSAQQ